MVRLGIHECELYPAEFHGTFLSDTWKVVQNAAKMPIVPVTQVFQEKLWIVGGQNGTQAFNDIYFTDDGLKWTKRASEPIFTARFGHRVATINDSMLLCGGYTRGAYPGQITYLNECYYSFYPGMGLHSRTGLRL